MRASSACCGARATCASIARRQALAAELAKDQGDLQGLRRQLPSRSSPAELAELEPHLRGPKVGGVLMPEPVSVADPGAVVKAYARLFEERGGRFVRGRRAHAGEAARRLAGAHRRGPGHGRRGGGGAGAVVGRSLPHARAVASRSASSAAITCTSRRKAMPRSTGPSSMSPNGYALTPMVKGIRLTTGAEFALRDAPPTPVQLDRVEPLAREIFPLGERVDAEPWLGRRPCLPDMLPMVGRAPGQDGAVAQLRPPSPGLHAGAGDGAAAGRDDDGRGAVHRSGALSRGSVLRGVLAGPICSETSVARRIRRCAAPPGGVC